MLAIASRFEGLSQKNSKQSRMTATFLPNAAWKQDGMVFHRSSRSGHIISLCNLTSIAISHFNSIRETVAAGQIYYAGSWFALFKRSFNMTTINSWKDVNFWEDKEVATLWWRFTKLYSVQHFKIRQPSV